MASSDDSDGSGGKRELLKELALGAGARGARVAGMFAKAAGRTVLGKLPGVGDQGEKIAEMMLGTLGELKGGYMKLGQILSYVNPNLSEQARKRLQQLCISVKPMEWDVIRGVIESEFGKPVDQLFKDITREPVASASIGQVHRATLPDGTSVAVKVQYPEISKAVDNDVDGMKVVWGAVGLVSGVEPEVVVEEMRKRFREECDYRQEAYNQETFYLALQDEAGIRVPRPFAQHSTTRVLTTEWMDGLGFDAFLESTSPAVRQELGVRIFTHVYRLLLERGLFHADPHPGNYLLGANDDLILLDFGCVKRCSVEFVDSWKQVLQALYEDDRAKFRQGTLRCGFVASERKFDFDYFWGLCQLLYKPLLSREPFQFTYDYVRECNRLQTRKNPNTSRTRLPADWLFVSRLQWGVNAMQIRLGTRTVYRDIVEPLFYSQTRLVDEQALRAQQPQRQAASG